ncbi:MAG TPA: NIL domain-containing protein [Egibacteraceae bacterium]|nr:NIL domain-containing protein [Actinomycetota bacterium]HWB70937.1 NIL domain-containing protein [Egibacteraceae bacterium]
MSVRRWHLTFPEHLVQQPIVYRLVADHGLVINIRRADVDDEYGWMLLECTGDLQALQGARDWLEELGVAVSDPQGDVVAG